MFAFLSLYIFQGSYAFNMMLPWHESYGMNLEGSISLVVYNPLEEQATICLFVVNLFFKNDLELVVIATFESPDAIHACGLLHGDVEAHDF